MRASSLCSFFPRGLVANAAEPAPKGETLTKEHASAFAKALLSKARSKRTRTKPGTSNSTTPTPNAKQLHPAFYGCYDWHSAVHGTWIARSRAPARTPDLPEAKEIRAVLAEHLTAENLKAEVEYFNRKEANPTRPLRWAWLD